MRSSLVTPASGKTILSGWLTATVRPATSRDSRGAMTATVVATEEHRCSLDVSCGFHPSGGGIDGVTRPSSVRTNHPTAAEEIPDTGLPPAAAADMTMAEQYDWHRAHLNRHR